MRPTIVCGVDRSANARAAARLARDLARRLGLGVELIHVLDRDSGPASDAGNAARRAVTEEYLGLPVAVQVKSGVTADVLAKAGRGAALLVIGTRGDGAVRQAPLGGVSSELTRDPSTPVIVVPPAAARSDALLDGRTIVCGVQDERDAAPAHVAARLAYDLGLTLTLAHVLRQPPIPAPSMLRATADELEAATRTLESIARSITVNTPVHVELDVLDGHPGPQLDRTAAARRATMLAMGACDQRVLAGALAGTPSRHLMRHGSRPVLVCPRPRRLTRFRARTADRDSPVAS